MINNWSLICKTVTAFLCLVCAAASAGSEEIESRDFYLFNLSLDAGNHTLEGSQKISYLNDSGADLGEIRLRLDINLSIPGAMEVLSVADNEGHELEWRYLPADRTLEINRVMFETEEELESVTVDPDAVCPDIDLSNNSWPVAASG